MVERSFSLGVALASSLVLAAAGAACGSTVVPFSTGGHTGSSGSTGSHAGSGGANVGGQGSGGSFVAGTGGGQQQGFDVLPSAMQTITVTAGQMMPAVTYTATLDGKPASAGWGLDKGNVGAIPAGPASSAAFTPTGTTGGLVTITAALNKMTVQRQVLVQLTAQQNGADPMNPAEQPQLPMTPAQLTAGGGVGGVGGEGLGGAVDMPTQMALGSPTGNGQAQMLTFQYPYDKTVWPRGLPAPLLMWDWSIGDADAIQIQLKTTSGSYSWTGTFGRPAILAQTMGKFIRHPIPQDVWDAATNSAGGADLLTVSLTVAKGGTAYGPISETWTVAAARLSGTIYYQSYGTQLVQNYGGAVGGNHMFGAAVLSIHVGDTKPTVVAGTNTDCRVCHSVAANGSRLVVQQGINGDVPSSAYDLSPMGSVEHMMAMSAEYPAMYPDGSMALTEAGQLLPLPAGGPPTATMGLAPTVTDLGTPAFSPDGTLITFNPHAGSMANPTQKLYMMGFDKATNTFSGATLIADDTGQPAATRPGWPAFFPDSKSVVYHHQTVSSCEDTLGTRCGAHAQIYWTSLNGPMDVTPLDQLNGKGYLPKLAAPIALNCSADGNPVGGIDNAHADDVDLNYEPTVNPVASGGYAWVVFTSRRMYGSVADIPPFCSDPRGVDLIQNITPKKLWVAAVDLSQAPGTDSSHPAFYVPAQELLAGNARGFWTLDPCMADGSSCMTGDQCCNGYCEASGDGGALVCSNMAPMGMCSQPEEKCTTAADCCDPTNLCINGFCSVKGPS